MAIFTRYTIREVFRAFLPAFIGMTILVVVAFSVQLLRQGVDVVRLRGIIPHLFCYAASMVISASFLTAIIMTFGRMADDNELLAVKCAGIHLRRVVTPVILLSVVASVMTAFLLMFLVPWSRRQISLKRFVAIKEILVNNIAITANRQLKVPPYIVSYGKFENGRMQNVQVIEFKQGVVQSIISAREGAVDLGAGGDQLPVLRLSSCSITNYSQRQSQGKSEDIFCKEIVLLLPMDVGSVPFDKAAYMGGEELLTTRSELIASTLDAEKIKYPRKGSKDLQKKRRDLRTAMKAVARKVDPVLERMQEQSREIDGVTRKLDATQVNIHNEQEDKIALEKELKRRTEQLRKLRSSSPGDTQFEQIEQIEKRMTQLREEIAAKDASLKTLRGAQAELGTAMEEKKKAARQLQKQIAQLRDERAVLLEKENAVDAEYQVVKDQYELLKIDVLLQKRLALAFSCVAFALIGIPFGVIAHRGNVVIALGLSFGVVLLIFYPVVIAAEFMARSGGSPYLLWGGDVVVALIGLAFLRRAVRK